MNEPVESPLIFVQSFGRGVQFPHTCTFDSDQGFLPQRLGLSLRCECGRWAMAGRGDLTMISAAQPTLCTRVEPEVSGKWIIALVIVLFLVALWAL